MACGLWTVWRRDRHPLHAKWRLIFTGRANEALKHYLKEHEGNPRVELRDPEGETTMAKGMREVEIGGA